MTGLSGLEFTSSTGARSKLTPAARSCSAVIWAALYGASPPTAARAMAPGVMAMSGEKRETTPPSWSMAIKGSKPVSATISRRSEVQSRSSCAALFTLRRKSMTLPTLHSRTSETKPGSSSVPGSPAMRRWPAAILMSTVIPPRQARGRRCRPSPSACARPPPRAGASQA